MLMLIMAEAGLRPSFVVGGDVTDVGTGAHWAKSDWLVVEADESDGTHLELPLYATILTNVEADHLDHYGSLDGIVAGFDTYLGQITGPKVVCGDDPIGRALADRHGGVTYGLDATNDVRAVDVEPSSGSFEFALERRIGTDAWERLGEIALPLRGLHNVANATGAAAMALEVGVAFDDIAGMRSRGSAALPAGSTFAAPTGVPPSSTTTPTCRRRSTRSWQRLAAAETHGNAWSRCSSRIATTGSPRCGRSTAGRSSRPTSSCSPRSTHREPCRSPASRAS